MVTRQSGQFQYTSTQWGSASAAMGRWRRTEQPAEEGDRVRAVVRYADQGDGRLLALVGRPPKGHDGVQLLVQDDLSQHRPPAEVTLSLRQHTVPGRRPGPSSVGCNLDELAVGGQRQDVLVGVPVAQTQGADGAARGAAFAFALLVAVEATKLAFECVALGAPHPLAALVAGDGRRECVRPELVLARLDRVRRGHFRLRRHLVRRLAYGIRPGGGATAGR